MFILSVYYICFLHSRILTIYSRIDIFIIAGDETRTSRWMDEHLLRPFRIEVVCVIEVALQLDLLRLGLTDAWVGWFMNSRSLVYEFLLVI